MQIININLDLPPSQRWDCIKNIFEPDLFIQLDSIINDLKSKLYIFDIPIVYFEYTQELQCISKIINIDYYNLVLFNSILYPYFVDNFDIICTNDYTVFLNLE